MFYGCQETRIGKDGCPTEGLENIERSKGHIQLIFAVTIEKHFGKIFRTIKAEQLHFQGISCFVRTQKYILLHKVEGFASTTDKNSEHQKLMDSEVSSC